MSILNFEQITEDLSELELKHSDEIKEIINLIFRNKTEVSNGRVCYGKLTKTPIKQPQLCKLINEVLFERHGLFVEIKLNSVRLRKYFNHFRSNGILPIIATSDGCYISDNKEEIEKQMVSLKQRARQIDKAAEGLRNFL